MIWFFERQGHYVRCETLKTPEGAYELQIRVENGSGGPTVETREPFVLARGDGP